jgi:hypothetical protein
MNVRRLACLLAALALPLAGCNALLAAGGLSPAQDPNAAQAAGAPVPESERAPTATPAGGTDATAPSTPSTPSAPIPTMVDMRNECSKTVRLFIGEKPKIGSGKTTTLGSNTTTSEGRKADGTQMIWIVDDKDNGLASANVIPTTKKVVIESSCTAIHAE